MSSRSPLAPVLTAALLATTACGARGVADGLSSAASTTGGGGGACGDPVLLASYAACLAAEGQTACESAGGAWTTVGLAPSPECQCSTGQEACPCSSSASCRSACIAVPSGVMGCTGVTSGHCSAVSITVGCWCFFDEQGQVQGICVD